MWKQRKGMILTTMFISTILNKRIVQFLTVLSVTVILLFTLIYANTKGQTKAKTQILFYNLQSIVKALDFFYNDQERYPTFSEFESNEIMGWYLSKYPVKDIVSDECLNSFRYVRLEPKKYDLYFCLAEDMEGYNVGWNKYSVLK